MSMLSIPGWACTCPQGRASLCSFLIAGCDMMRLAAELDRRHIAVRCAEGRLLCRAGAAAVQGAMQTGL